MKRALLVLLLVGLIGFLGCEKPAEAADQMTSRGKYTTFNSNLTTFLNETDCFYHTHDYDKGIDNPLGIGIDVKFYDFTKDKKENGEQKVPFLVAINGENKYDFNNENYSFFLVLEMDLTSLWQK